MTSIPPETPKKDPVFATIQVSIRDLDAAHLHLLSSSWLTTTQQHNLFFSLFAALRSLIYHRVDKEEQDLA